MRWLALMLPLALLGCGSPSRSVCYVFGLNVTIECWPALPQPIPKDDYP
jgi:hypothetical protein